MKVHYDPLDGFTEESFHDDATHDIPDAEWAAYRKLVEAANSLEDRFVAGYAIQVDEFAAVRGILSDEQIESLKVLGVSFSDVPAGKVYHENSREPTPRQAISAEQAAREIIARNANKCQHRHQRGPFADGTVRCADCQGIIYGGAGVKKTIDSAGEQDYHNPGRVNPDDYNGTV